MVILILNLIQVSGTLFAIIWPPWYDDSNDNESDPKYGLLLTHENGNIRINGY